MSRFLVLAFLFFIGSLFGWCLELVFRKFFSSANPEHKWINPGFLVGPYVPLYGCGLVILYLIASVEQYSLVSNPVLQKILLFAFMAVAMTVIEYIAGIFLLKVMNLKLWDYSNCWGNYKGLICPLFSFFWTLLGAVYYFAIHSHVLNALAWLSENLAFSFVIGFFYGVFIIDLVHSTHLLVKLRRFADEKQIVIHYEELKERSRSIRAKNRIRASFLFSMHVEEPLAEALADYYEHKEQAREALRRYKNR